MTHRFSLSGSFTSTPQGGEPSFDSTIAAPIDEVVTLAKRITSEVPLDGDAPVDVDFAGIANANVVMLKSTGGVKVRARFTSTDGSAQSIPFDTYLILMSLDVPITAIDITRLTGAATTVRVFLGEEAT